MIKRINITLLMLFLFLNSFMTVFACNEEQTKVYVLKILFGNDDLRYESDTNVEKLLSALYLCSEQSNGNGQEKLDLLRKAKVSGIPALEKINISGDMLLECSHNNWKYEGKRIKKVQDIRKKVLRKTVMEMFDFGWFNETFKSKSGQIDSFSALLYYFHILADYLADDPIDTEISVNGYDIPAYFGVAAIELHGNKPEFEPVQKVVKESYVRFEGFDKFGRTGEAMANIGPDILAPAGSRQQIGIVKPSGWAQEKYQGLINSEPPYLYNRCHLIAHQLVNIDESRNLITGTRYLNESMIPYENEVTDYIRKTGYHVLYRATPVYAGDNLVASGVQLEAYSVEDNGMEHFNVYLYNVQPGIDISYANGSSEQADKVYDNDNVIPLAVLNPDDNNSDLLYEISKQLEVLFTEQQESGDYKMMMNELNSIADKVRIIGENNKEKVYIERKKYEYEFVEKLAEYVPDLLEKEKFFNTTF